MLVILLVKSPRSASEKPYIARSDACLINAPWPGWSVALALSFYFFLTLFHWGFKRWLLHRGKVPGGETEAISSCCGPHSPAAGLQQALLPRKPQHKTWHSLSCTARFHALPQLSLQRWAFGALSTWAHPWLRRWPPAQSWLSWKWVGKGDFRPAKQVVVLKLDACVIYAELTRLFVLSRVAQIPALVSTKHYSCARSSFKSLIPMVLLTCARIPRLCAWVPLTSLQGQILLLSADLHHYARDKNLKPERLSGERKISLKPDDSPPLPHSPRTFPTSVASRAARGKLCSFGSPEHCRTPGVKMRRHFDFGDLWPSSCCIRGAHRCSQPSPPLQLSAHFFSGSRVVLYLGNYNY